MTTSNTTLSTSWTKIANATDNDFLASWDTTVSVEFAVTAADSAPTVQGHVFPARSAVTRSMLTNGFVWAKLLAGSVPSSANLSITKGAVSETIAMASRTCLGRQTITALSASTPATLTIPTGAVAASIQADGGIVRITLDGSTNPTATVGQRIDDGVLFYVDSSLTGVKLLAQSGTSTNVQIAYFDRA